MKLFGGLDVSLAKPAVCVLTEQGEIVREVDVAGEPDPLITLFRDLEGNTEAIRARCGAVVAMAAPGDDSRRVARRPDGNPAGEGRFEGDADQG